MIRLAPRVHERFGDWVAATNGIVQEQVGGADFAGLIALTGGRCFDALFEQALEMALCWAQTVGGPAAEEARVVLRDLLGGVSGYCVWWRWACLPGET